MILIAEVKVVSPFGYQAQGTWAQQFALASKVGDWVSVHTDARWGGSFELLRAARSLTKKPILAKGIHATDMEIEHALECGADWVLCVGRVPKRFADKCIVEPNTIADLVALPKAQRACWNARNLATGLAKTQTFGEARQVFSGWLCQASFICSRIEVHPGAQAVLIGEGLQDYVNTAR